MRRIDDDLLFGCILAVCIIAFIWILVLLIPDAQGYPINLEVHSSVNLTIDQDFARVFVNNAQLFAINKTDNTSNTFVVGGSNTTEANSTILAVQLQNNTQVLNYTCDLTNTNIILTNLTDKMNDTVNSTFLRELINKKNDEMQAYFDTNIKPVSDKLLQCQKDLNNLQLSQNSCLINNSFYNNLLLQKDVEVQNANEIKNLFVTLSILLGLLMLAFFFVIFKQGWKPSNKTQNAN